MIEGEFIAVVVGCGVALAWSALALRLLSRLGAYQGLEASAGPPKTNAPAVAAIVPAHNEAGVIEAVVASLRAQDYPALTITVIDDQSTDATGAILDRLVGRQQESGSHPLRVIHGTERPGGWVGKTWALRQGVAESKADWLWFVDGDVQLHPKALATAWEVAEAERADLVSFLARPVCETFWQGTVALAFMQVIAQLYPLDQVNDPARGEAIAAGGFILIRRSVYEHAGGHEAVRHEIVEDIRLAERVKGSGGRLAVRVAPELAWTHMYGGFGEIWRGLRKNAYAGMKYQFHKYLVGAIIALFMAWTPLVAIVLGVSLAVSPDGDLFGTEVLVGVGLWGWLAQAIASAPMLRYLRLPVAFGFSLPAGISAYVAIASASVWHHHRGRVLWKGRVFNARTVDQK